jgi:hypothetical protein
MGLFCMRIDVRAIYIGNITKMSPKNQVTEWSVATSEHSTANPRIIDVRYHDFNGFPVVDWY